MAGLLPPWSKTQVCPDARPFGSRSIQEQLFLPWHRPFVLLYEVCFPQTGHRAPSHFSQQVLVGLAKRLALEYPTGYRDQYISAADELRSPFWDWGVETEVPPATVPKTLRVKIPKGELLEEVEIDNPLATFRFPKEASLAGEYGPFDSNNRTQTYRCPSPESYPDSANRKLASRPYKSWIVSNVLLP